MKYYVAKANSIFGPFSLEDFKSLDIKIFPGTFIWHDALDGWTEAKDIFDLKEIIDYSKSPANNSILDKEIINDTEKLKPIFQQKKIEEIPNNKEIKRKQRIGVLVFFVIIIIASVFGNIISDKNSSSNSSPNESSKNSSSGCQGFGSQGCIDEIRKLVTGAGKEILSEQYEGDGKFEIQFEDYGRGAYNAEYIMDCNCTPISVNVTPLN